VPPSALPPLADDVPALLGPVPAPALSSSLGAAVEQPLAIASTLITNELRRVFGEKVLGVMAVAH
jgi:hypothetical protein